MNGFLLSLAYPQLLVSTNHLLPIHENRRVDPSDVYPWVLNLPLRISGLHTATSIDFPFRWSVAGADPSIICMLDVSHRKADKVHRAIRSIKRVFKSKQRAKGSFIASICMLSPAHRYLALEDNLPRQRSLEDAIIYCDNAAKIAAKLNGRVVQMALHGQRDENGGEHVKVIATVKGKGKQRMPVQDETTYSVQTTSFVPSPSRSRSIISQPLRRGPIRPGSLFSGYPPTPDDSLVPTPTTSHDIVRAGESSSSAANNGPPPSWSPYSDDNYPKYPAIPMIASV